MSDKRLTLADVARIVRVGAAEASPRAILEPAGDCLMRCTGALGYTVFRHVPGSDEVERIFSSDPAAYPVGGRKRAADYAVSEAVTARGQVYIAADGDEIRKVYRDSEVILSIGVTSIMNVPIRWTAQNIGAINVLGVAGQFTSAHADDALVLAGLMVPAVLCWDRERVGA